MGNRNPNWKDGEKDQYVPPHDCIKPNYYEGGRFKDMLLRILDKVMSDKMRKGMKKMFTLSNTITSHAVSIKQLETHISHILSHLNPRPKESFPIDIMANPKSEI